MGPQCFEDEIVDFQVPPSPHVLHARDSALFTCAVRAQVVKQGPPTRAHAKARGGSADQWAHEVAFVRKQWAGLAQEWLTDADNVRDPLPDSIPFHSQMGNSRPTSPYPFHIASHATFYF